MALRSEALCEGKIIGIETIYTIIDGQQVNIPEKLKELRKLSRENRLFCKCGCGANLILVAGDNNLREQHFRIRDSEFAKECQLVTEGKTSVDSKIILKCWLDDNLHADDIESRVPVSDVSDSNRKYEFTFIIRSKQIALDYCYDRANLSTEKLSILDENKGNLRMIYIVDHFNGGTEGQYPEGLMKIQDRQGYCLLLTISELFYEKAMMKAVFYEKNLDGLWEESVFADDSLKCFRINDHGDIVYKNDRLTELLSEARKTFAEKQDKERTRREELKKQRLEYERQQKLLEQQQLEEEQKMLEEQKRLIEERERQRKEQEAEAERIRVELEEQRRIAAEKKAEEKRKRDEEFKNNLASALSQQEKKVVDADGNRWIKCEFCGKIAKDSEFSSYGGPGHINLGICKECRKNNPDVKLKLDSLQEKETKKKTDSNICPICRIGKLVERYGIKGKFIGCSNFPNCRYTRSI